MDRHLKIVTASMISALIVILSVLAILTSWKPVAMAILIVAGIIGVIALSFAFWSRVFRD